MTLQQWHDTRAKLEAIRARLHRLADAGRMTQEHAVLGTSRATRGDARAPLGDRRQPPTPVSSASDPKQGTRPARRLVWNRGEILRKFGRVMHCVCFMHSAKSLGKGSPRHGRETGHSVFLGVSDA